MKKIPALIALALVGVAFLPGQKESTHARIMRLAAPFPDSTQVAIGVLERGKKTTIGFMKLRGRLVLVKNQDHVFGIASLTKIYTSALIAILVQEKKLSLSDELSKFYPFKIRYSGQVPPVTIEGLCSHSSGLPENGPGVESFLKKGVHLSHAGGKYRYSNLGFMILGDVLERVSGKKYRDLLAEKLMRPLRLRHTGTGPATAGLQPLVSGRDAAGRALPVQTSYAYESVGSIKSTVSDMLTFLIYQFHRPSVLRPAFRLMQKSVVRINRAEGAGLGWKILYENGGRVYHHNGLLAGYTAALRYSTAQERGVVVLSNVSGLAAYASHIEKIALVCMEGS